MSAIPTSLLCGALLALSSFAARAADAPAAPSFDAASAWKAFLARPDADKGYAGYDLLEALSYDEHAVDAGACAAHRDELARAVAAAPVGIALRHAAMLCAQASGDQAGAAREAAALDALSALAFSQAISAESDLAPPIRVMNSQDAHTLLTLAGLEAAYEYYASLRPARYFAYVKVVVDPKDGHERHLAFDALDTIDAVVHGDPYSGYPMQRMQLADQLVENEAANGLQRGLDLKALREASLSDDAAAKVARLREAANAGGIQSLAGWLMLCQLAPSPGCADGLVDALLPGAEQRHALPMALLAMAYANGIGVGRDEKAASALLDAADERWRPAAASATVAAAWLATGKGEMPSFVRARVDRAIAAGNQEALLALASWQSSHQRALDDGQRAALATPAFNLRGAGYALLARDALVRDREEEAIAWTRRAAEAGSPWGEEQFGWRLRFGRGVGRDPDAALALLRAAAHDARPLAARMLAGEAVGKRAWDEAGNWLMAPAAAADVDALLDLAALMVEGRLGPDKVRTGVDVYRKLAESDIAEARRRLAALALEGVGIDKSPAQAEAWLRTDAERGDHRSEALLGGGYLRGAFGKVDEVQGTQWSERAVVAKDPAALLEYGAWLYYTKATADSRRRALELWTQGVDLDEPGSANNLAWALCTAPFDDIRQPQRGLEVSARIGDVDDIDAGDLDTVAACHAATGDFAGAAEMQRRVVAKFADEAAQSPDEAGVASTIARMKARLALYEAGKPYLETDRD